MDLFNINPVLDQKKKSTAVKSKTIFKHMYIMIHKWVFVTGIEPDIQSSITHLDNIDQACLSKQIRIDLATF